VARKLIGKKELCLALGWARTRLDRRLKTDPNFPVVSRGDQAGGWAFDLAEVLAYLDGKPPPEEAVEKSPAVDQAQLRDAVKSRLPKVERHTPKPRERASADHKGEATAAQRKNDAQASLLEVKLAQQRAELVDRGELRQLLSDLFAQLGADLDALPETLARRFDLPDAAIPAIRKLIDDARADMVRRAAPLLAEDEPK
jgi:phage terminase Nu1 subunit (DNA packaging protein)